MSALAASVFAVLLGLAASARGPITATLSLPKKLSIEPCEATDGDADVSTGSLTLKNNSPKSYGVLVQIFSQDTFKSPTSLGQTCETTFFFFTNCVAAGGSISAEDPDALLECFIELAPKKHVTLEIARRLLVQTGVYAARARSLVCCVRISSSPRRKWPHRPRATIRCLLESGAFASEMSPLI
mmetsp:Transcript_18474/g.60131  ORF Transcript_18474/g.60131 Transcript_18474/m.60131 type:complete len:184 (+) Transcript_18474:410-961(+)